MANITWTDTLVTGDILTATHITAIKSDITTVVNGGVTDANVSATADIVESKLKFSTSTGHVHNGTDASYPLIKHYRRGMQVQYASATTVTVLPGVLDVGGKLFITTASTTLNITTDFLGGQAEPADGPVYIYAYNNSGTIGFKMSTSCPALSDSASNTAEFPLRYYGDATIGKCRLIGIIHNWKQGGAEGNIQADMCNNFDLSGFATGSFVGDGVDEIIYTGWTPNYISWVVCSDSTPATGETIDIWGFVQGYGFITANPQPQALYYNNIAAAPTHLTSADGTANTVYSPAGVTGFAQTTAVAGQFAIDAPTSGQVVMWCAWSKGMGSI